MASPAPAWTVSSWTIPIHSTAVNWQMLVDQNGYGGRREKSQLRLEGKDYIVKGGDVLVIHHG